MSSEYDINTTENLTIFPKEEVLPAIVQDGMYRIAGGEGCIVGLQYTMASVNNDTVQGKPPTLQNHEMEIPLSDDLFVGPVYYIDDKNERLFVYPSSEEICKLRSEYSLILESLKLESMSRKRRESLSKKEKSLRYSISHLSKIEVLRVLESQSVQVRPENLSSFFFVLKVQ